MSSRRSKEVKHYLRNLAETVVGFEELTFEDINQTSEISTENALHRAALDGNVTIAEELIALGIDVNAEGDLRQTPLHIAVHQDDREMIVLLMRSGANLLAKDDLHGQPPFFSAALHKNTDLLKFFFCSVFGRVKPSTSSEISGSWIAFHEERIKKHREQL